MRSESFARLGTLLCLLLAACEGKGPAAPQDPAPQNGSLQLAVHGLSDGDAADIEITGPGNYSRIVQGDELIEDLAPGAYSISASAVQGAQRNYSPSPAWQQATVIAGELVHAQVLYSEASSSSYDLSVAAAYLVQSTQRLDGSVPLMAGRDALLRVFVVANELSPLLPQIRVTLFDAQDEELVSYLVDAPGLTVPLDIDQSDLDQSWNQDVVAQYVVPGLKISVDVDPSDVIDESNEVNNHWPPTGTQSLDVCVVGDLTVRFVPVHQSATGLTGDVHAGNVDDYMELAHKLWPTAGYVADVRSTYTTSAPALQSNDGNGSWSSVLSEIWALRQSESAGSDRHYYGVVDVNYSSGIAGLAYLSAHAGLGRDLAYPSLAVIFPHELGHNLSLPHAGCGISGGDPDYPYANGQIGVYGLDYQLSVVKAPSMVDVMSYCSNIWISDYNYEQALAWRVNASKRPTQRVGAAIEPCYLIWGSVHDGGIELNPVVELDARPVVPSEGSLRLSLERTDGESRVLGFDGVQLSDGGRPGERHFAWLLPRADFVGSASLLSVTVSSEGHGAVVDAPASSRTKASSPTLRADGDATWVEWDAAARPLLLLRDADSAEILSFARGGRLRLPRALDRIEYSLSDGIRSERGLLIR